MFSWTEFPSLWIFPTKYFFSIQVPTIFKTWKNTWKGKIKGTCFCRFYNTLNDIGLDLLPCFTLERDYWQRKKLHTNFFILLLGFCNFCTDIFEDLFCTDILYFFTFSFYSWSEYMSSINNLVKVPCSINDSEYHSMISVTIFESSWIFCGFDIIQPIYPEKSDTISLWVIGFFSCKIQTARICITIHLIVSYLLIIFFPLRIYF